MLPGFRFLFAAIVLSMSVLVFALGAAALLRAAHEEVASTPAWRPAPEPKFARQEDAPREATREILRDEPMPVLAILRVEPEPVPPAAKDSVAAAAAPAEPPAVTPLPEQPDKIAALEPQDKTPAVAAKPDVATPEISVPGEAPAAADAPAPAEETGTAAVEQALVEQALPPATEAVAPAPEPATVPPAAGTDLIASKIATLGGPPVAIEAPPAAKAASARPDPDARKKRLQARRAKERRRIALRARQAAAQQQAADPFAQPAITPRSR